ncbi:hypothetical protein LMB96_01750 [Limosilactobacillus reuteri]|uniref:hypothetical protein n=1 Tax=Limosilactobacillus reuteri TaxID=1598 RepID=UPI001E3403D6|nr:hypothetical protein [Limosilactobacillus reuteri]MCC4421085.1 hypothetical protein [Limosilactobacillus reuteri]
MTESLKDTQSTSDVNMYLLSRWEITPKRVRALIDKYCDEHDEITPGQKQFLKKLPSPVWDLQMPNYNPDAMSYAVPQYDFRQYFKLFLDNPYLPQHMLKYPNKYKRLQDEARNYELVVYKRGIYRITKRYKWLSYYEFGYGLCIQGKEDRVRPVSFYKNIKEENKKLKFADPNDNDIYYGCYMISGNHFEDFGHYDDYQELVLNHPEFAGTQKDLTKVLHAYGLKNKFHYRDY